MAISILLSGEDLAETRFAFSPIWELGMSLYKPMRDPAKHALHLPWVQEARKAIEGHDLSLLFAVVPPEGIGPNVHPYTSSPRRRRRRSPSSRTSSSTWVAPTPIRCVASWST